MLDRVAVEEFLKREFDETELEIPQSILKSDLVEAFCQYTEDDYYEWLKDNFKSFFENGNPNWALIEKKTKQYKH